MLKIKYYFLIIHIQCFKYILQNSLTSFNLPASISITNSVHAVHGITENVAYPFSHKSEERQSNLYFTFQVEYILGFGAAFVIVLTIIIVIILYLILQCRQKR